MSARLAAFVTWALVAASAVYWALKLFVAPAPAPPHAANVAAAPLRGDLARVFGAPPADEPAAAAPAPAVASRFQLIGVAAPREGQAGPGVALIAIDGKPARPYRVGAVVDGDWQVQSIRARGVSLGPSGGASALSLELPALPPPSTGTLPRPGTPLMGTPAPALPPQPVVVPPPPNLAPQSPVIVPSPPLAPNPVPGQLPAS
jgi:general secretion pathway protein C